MNKDTQFLLVNNLLVVVALIGVAFDFVGIYAPFFAISVALQITHLRKSNSEKKK